MDAANVIHLPGNDNIIFRNTDIRNASAEAVGIMVSAGGSVMEQYAYISEWLDIPSGTEPVGRPGEVSFVPAMSDKLPGKQLKGVFYITVLERTAYYYTAMRQVGIRLAEEAGSRDINSIVYPVPGINSDSLEESIALQVLALSFKEECNRTGKQCKLEIFVYDGYLWSQLQEGIPFEGSSAQLAFRAVVKQCSSYEWVLEIAGAKDFYFEKARQVFNEYLAFTPKGKEVPVFYDEIIGVIQQEPKFLFRNLLTDSRLDEEQRSFLVIMGRLITYIDSRGYNKHIWNEYADKRTMARSGVRQNRWVEHLLRYKTGNSLEALPPNIRNAVRYLHAPAQEPTMLSERHRQMMLAALFDRSYIDSSSFEAVFDFFSLHIQVVNPENTGALYTRLLYINEIKPLWYNNSIVGDIVVELDEDDVESPDDEPTAAAARRIKPMIHSDLFADRDLLNYKIYAHAIAEFIKHKDTRPPLTIGIFAPWGKGKTTMMRFIQQKLDGRRDADAEQDTATQAKYEDLNGWLDESETKPVRKYHLKNPTVWFNAWKFQKSEQIWAGFVHEIIHQLVNKLPNEKEKERFWLELNLQRIDRRKIKDQVTILLINKVIAGAWWLLLLVLAAVAAFFVIRPALPVGSFLLGGPLVAWIFGTKHYWDRFNKQKIDFDISKYVRQPDYDEKQGYFHQVEKDLKYALEILVSKNDPVVIFIDDLDRCSPTVVAEVVEAINLFISGDFPDCYFILGQDAQMVAASLDAAYKEMEAKVNTIHRGHGSLGWYFMEKFIQLQFNIPNISAEQSQSYFKALFNKPEGTAAANGQAASTAAAEAFNSLSQQISAEASNDNFAVFNENIKALEQKLPVAAAEKVLLLKEQVVSRAAESFTDEDLDVEQMIEAYAGDLGSSPRAIKRFVNLYRFYRFMQFTGQSEKLADVDSITLGRWIMLSIRWPQLIRCIQWDTEKDFLSGHSPAQRAALFEQQLLGVENIAAWRQYLANQQLAAISWLADEQLFTFMHKTKGEEGSLEQAVSVGFW